MNTRKSILQFLVVAAFSSMVVFPSIEPVNAGGHRSFSVSNVEATNRQEIAANPSFIEIATIAGQREVISFEEIQHKPFWQEIEPSISSAISVFNENRKTWEERDDLVIEDYHIIIPGATNSNGQIEPLLTPLDADGAVVIPHLYFSTDSRGYFFIRANSSWSIFVSEMGDLRHASPDQPSEYVVIAEGYLVALGGMNTDTPFAVANGKPNSDTRRVEWNEVVDQSVEVVDSVFAEQIPAEELGIYTSGIRYQSHGKTWEFISDLPYELDADSTDLTKFHMQVKRAIHAINAGLYESPTFDTVRVILEHDEQALAAAPAAMYPEGFGTITTEFIEDQALIIERIPYSQATLDMLKMLDSNPDNKKAVINAIYLYQLVFGRVTRGRRDRSWELFFEKMGLPGSPSLADINNEFNALGVKVQ